MHVEEPPTSEEPVAGLTLTLGDLRVEGQLIELGVTLTELDEIAELRRIVGETTEAPPMLYSTA